MAWAVHLCTTKSPLFKKKWFDEEVALKLFLLLNNGKRQLSKKGTYSHHITQKVSH